MLNNRLLLLAAFMQIVLSISGAAPPPCDSFEAGGTPCVAAHSIVRALYAKYTGPLYRVTRNSGQSMDILTLSPGGVADSASQAHIHTDTHLKHSSLIRCLEGFGLSPLRLSAVL